jgi:HYR domain-containing protein/Big-like domain-containing protein
MARRRLTLVAVLLGCVLLATPDRAAAAPASIAVAQGAPATQTARLTEPFGTALIVVVRDGAGAPVAGASVHFQAPLSGASAQLSASDVVTDAGGTAAVTATANATGGVYTVAATVAGVSAPARFSLLNLAPGYSPGEQLASVPAFDETGAARNLRDFLENGQSFLLIDVCDLSCSVCRVVAGEAQDAVAELAEFGIKVRVVPLLRLGDVQASTQSDAAAWRAQNGLSESVIHASGSTTSAAYTAAVSILRNSPAAALPTSALVAPDGTIVDRKVGSDNLTREAIVDRVLGASDLGLTEALSAQTSVTRGAQTLSGLAAPQLQGPLGTVEFGSDIVLAQRIERTSVSVDAAQAFQPGADTLHLEVTPNWPDGRPRTTTQTQAALTLHSRLDGEPVQLGTATGTVPFTFNAGKLTADVDLAAIRAEIDAAVQEAVADGAITQEQAEEVMTELKGLTLDVTFDVDFSSPAAPQLTSTTPVSPSSDNTIAVRGSAPTATTVRLFGDAACAGAVLASAPAATLAASGIPLEVAENATTTVRATATGATGKVSACSAPIAYREDSQPPVIAATDPVTVETVARSVVVKYPVPTARDSVSGVVKVTCKPASGSTFPQGRTTVECAARDQAGNEGRSQILVTVKAPTTSGAVFTRDGKRKLTKVKRGQKVLVVAGGYAPRRAVGLAFGTTKLGKARASRTGRISFRTRIPEKAERGPSFISATGRGTAGGTFVRVWALKVR